MHQKTRQKLNVLWFIFLQAQKKELDHIRQKYRKNSLARTPTMKQDGNETSQQFFDSGTHKRIDEED